MEITDPAVGDPDDSVCGALGLEVRRFYVEQKSARMRRPYRMNPRFDTTEFWVRVGALVYKLRCTPELFIRALFEASKEKHGPFPNTLAGDWAKRAWAFWEAQHKEGVSRARETPGIVDTTELDTYFRDLYREVKELFKHDLMAALTSPTCTAPPFLRLLLAPQSPVVWEQWGELGLRDLQESPDLIRQSTALGLPVGMVLRGNPFAAKAT